MTSSLNFLAAGDPVLPPLGWLIAGLIVVVILAVFGLSDVARFSFRRVWAISGVCFDESIRKRVLWITPLAIVGVLVVTQFQRALDEQDAIRQTTKFCLFATGLVVTITSIILACTNLPKEIENRVIFTIVTKPTTRLEIIAGKVLGFARVSAAILLIMGLFTWGYLQVRSWGKQKDISYRLREGDLTPTERTTLEHYQQAGLLTARGYARPASLQIYGRPANGDAQGRSFYDAGEEDVLYPYDVDKQKLFEGAPDGGIGQRGLLILLHVKWDRYGAAPSDPSDEPAATQPIGPGLTVPASQAVRIPPPVVGVSILDENRFSLINSAQIRDGSQPENKNSSAARLPLRPKGDDRPVVAYVPAETAQQLFNHPHFYVQLFGGNLNTEYVVEPGGVQLLIPNGNSEASAVEVPPATGPDGKPMEPVFRGRIAIHGGEQLKGGPGDHIPVAVFGFRDAKPPAVADGRYAFELKSSDIERTGADVQEDKDDPTNLDVTIRDAATGKTTPVAMQIESRQTAYFTVPTDAITGPDYDLIMRCRSKGHFVALDPDSAMLVSNNEGFTLNLAKSLLIMWMMTVLVVSFAVLCSTFLSWPIAVVLTVVLLLGRWGVMQLADSTGPGLGRMVVNDFFKTSSNAAEAKVISTSVDFLSTQLNNVARVLPDISRFESIADIEQGVTVPTAKLVEAGKVLVGFAVPAVALAYLSLKMKEVAP